MGTIRVILALSVLGAHYHIEPSLGLAGPTVAVKFFYRLILLIKTRITTVVRKFFKKNKID